MTDHFINLPLRNYIEYSNENKDLYWVNIGYNLNLVELKIMNIFFNVFQLKYGKSYKVSGYFRKLKYYIMILRMCIDTIVQQDYDFSINTINFENKIIPITSIMGSILSYYENPDFKTLHNKNKIKNISDFERTYINNTLIELELALEFLQKQHKIIEGFRYKDIKKCCDKITQIINNIKINI